MVSKTMKRELQNSETQEDDWGEFRQWQKVEKKGLGKRDGSDAATAVRQARPTSGRMAKGCELGRHRKLPACRAQPAGRLGARTTIQNENVGKLTQSGVFWVYYFQNTARNIVNTDRTDAFNAEGQVNFGKWKNKRGSAVGM